MTDIGIRIKQLRNEKGLTMDLFVEDINKRFGASISKSQVSRWENLENDPSLQNATHIANYFDVSLDYMLGLTDVRLPSRFMAYTKGVARGMNNEH